MKALRSVLLVGALALVASGCTLYGFGDNGLGQLGDGTRIVRRDPTPAARNPNWVKVDAGFYHACGLDAATALYCWGNNTSGELGIGASGSVTSKDVPTRVGNETGWSDVSAAGSSSSQGFSCGIRSGGLYCWGHNQEGQLGVGDTNVRVSPTQVGTETDWKSVHGGYAANCAIKQSGALFCWGSATVNGTAVDQSSPVQIGTASDWRSVSVGRAHACGVRGNNALYCWGNNRYGELGLGSVDPFFHATPQRVDATKTWSSVAAGSVHTCAIAGGALYCFGYNISGELGIGTFDDPDAEIAHPVPTMVGTASDWTAIAAGEFATCGIRGGGLLFCWGNGIAGDGTGFTAYAVPTRAQLDRWTSVSVGGLHKLALRNLAP